MYKKELYDFYKENGICVTCGQEHAVKGRVRCFECLARNALSEEKRRNSETSEQQAARLAKLRANREKRYSSRKEKGLCVYCGKPVCKTSTVYCIDHKILNQRKNNKRTLLSKQLRAEMGICVTCGKEKSIPSKKVCKKCYDNNLKNLKIANNSEKTLQNRKQIKNLNRLIFNN